MHLTLFQTGDFIFSGHFHDSGGLEYNLAMVIGVKDADNNVTTFDQTGHVSGTFQSGSSDLDWNTPSHHPLVAGRWHGLCASNTAVAKSTANGDLVNTTNAVIGALGLILAVVALFTGGKSTAPPGQGDNQGSQGQGGTSP